MTLTQLLIMRGESLHHKTVARGLRNLTAGNYNTWQVRTYRAEAEKREAEARRIEDQIDAILSTFPELEAQFTTLAYKD